MAVIEDRKANPPAKSYTTSLLAGGVRKIGAKITEEAAEVVGAAGEPGDQGRAHLIYESGDLLYHPSSCWPIAGLSSMRSKPS
jgi:phosphoribosyl-ATP pyrophosphohydrolase